MKKLKSFSEFINEAATPAPSKPTPTVTPPPKEDEDEKKPATTPAPTATPPAEGEPAATDPNAVPGADATTDPNATPGADATATAGATGTPDLGGIGGAPAGDAGATATGSAGTADAGGLGAPPSSSGMSSGSSDGAGLGEPLSDEGTDAPPKQDATAEQEPKKEDYIPPVSKFNLVIMDKGARWEQEYPDGGGVKEMTGYEVTWKDLNKWITENNLAAKKQEIAEYLLGENDDLDNAIKTKLKNAFTSKTLGGDTGETEVEFDEDQTPYVQDINTIIVDL